MTQEQKRERISYIAMASGLAVFLLVGTFADQPIAAALFSPHNVLATIVTTLGVYPFFTAVVFFMGVLCERIMHSQLGRVVKDLLGVCVLSVAAFIGFIGAAALVDGDCLGGILPSLNRNIPVIVVLAVLLEWPLFVVGYRLAKRTKDPLLLKRVLILVIVMIAAYYTMQLTKGIFNRPRYRTVVLGYEGVGFVPWYKPSPSPADLIAQFGLDKNEFSSFPSGHAILTVSSVYILYSLTWLFPALRNKRFTLCVSGFSFALVIMITRMVLGAHYLSDVSAGGLIGLGFVLLYNFAQRTFCPQGVR